MKERLKDIGRFVIRPQARHNMIHESQRRRRGHAQWPAHRVSRALVICHGNICRSPFAERLLAERMPAWTVCSGGLHAGAGSPAEPGARRVCHDWDIDLEDHTAMVLDDELVDWADLVIGMEGHHLVQLYQRFPAARGKALVLGEFLEAGPFTIEDPWGRDDGVFRSVFERIVRATDRMIEHARSLDDASPQG